MKRRTESDSVECPDYGTVERTIEMLRLLATAGRYGLALTQVASAAKLPHPSAHRLLRRLIAERMVVQRDSDKRYMLGPLSMELGFAASLIYDLRDPCRPILERLAAEIGDTVYLTVRSGSESVCADRFEGMAPIRVVTLEVGSRRPLGLGAGGLAILAAIPSDEREFTIAYLARRHSETKSLQPSELRGAIDTCRRRGYALIHSQVTLGTTAVGVAILDTLNNPIAAISVAAVDNRMSVARIELLSRRLQAAATTVQDTLRHFAVQH
jgi:DNA-binding IclR family transcriptional regulator